MTIPVLVCIVGLIIIIVLLTDRVRSLAKDVQYLMSADVSCRKCFERVLDTQDDFRSRLNALEVKK